MRTIKTLTIATATMLLVAGCVSTEGIPDYRSTPMRVDGYITPITKASDAGFAPGDAMGVFVADNTDASTPGLFTASRAVNIMHAKTETSWEPATPILWTDNTTKVTLWGVYPYDASMTAASATYQFTLQTDQSSVASPGVRSGYEASDLLWAKTATPVNPTVNAIGLQFIHKLSKISLTLAKSADLAADITTGVTVRIGALPLTADVNLEDGTISATSDNGIITASKVGDYLYQAIVIPSAVVTDLKFTVEVGGTIYESVFPAATFTQSKQHNYKLTLSNSPEIEITDNGIKDWDNKNDPSTPGDATPNS